MQPEDLQEQWKEQGEEAMAAVAQWRVAHPQATLAEIEQAVDEQMHRLRARMIEQAAQASAAAESEVSQGLVCEQCGLALQARGRARRRWKWNARMSVARSVEAGFYPPWIRNCRCLMGIGCRRRRRRWCGWGANCPLDG
jgi:hypothetical protein